jgi:hypothetical protein
MRVERRGLPQVAPPTRHPATAEDLDCVQVLQADHYPPVLVPCPCPLCPPAHGTPYLATAYRTAATSSARGRTTRAGRPVAKNTFSVVVPGRPGPKDLAADIVIAISPRRRLSLW